ncbi:MAG: S-layer protein [Candidatus Altiarchaeia archaeon]
MKSMNIRRVGSLVAGTAMLGAALSAPVMAGMDSTGITKGFFYDASFNPIVQIVVGEKGLATDAVAAGNIAATVGNLAYMTQTVTGSGPSYTPEGQVVITTAARGAIGDYVQDTDIAEDTPDFYDADLGLFFQDSKTYEKGDFTSYTLSCDKQTRTEAGLLMEGSYTNIHCLFCHNLCLEALENPAHDMKEKIDVNSSKIFYYEEGINDDDSESLKMAIKKGAVSYQVETDYIPMKRITKDSEDCDGDECYIDFEYRGKMILFGEEYYVKDVDGSDKIYLAKAKVLDDVTSEGFTAEYKGYKFKVDHLIYAAEYTVAGILLDVQKPDGTIVQVQISKMANGVVDNMELSGVYAEEAAALQSASIIVYDLSTQVLLENGEDLEIGGQVKTDWEVEFATVNYCQDANDATDETANDCAISEYDEQDTEEEDSLLKSVTVTYNHDLDGDEALEKDESLNFPNNFRITFKGYLTNKFKESDLSGQDNGNIKLERGDDNYQATLTFTGEDDNTYSKVRLDEGPFKKNDLFMLDGTVYKYDTYEKQDNSDGTTDDTIDVTLDPQIRGNRDKIKDLKRYCDDKDDGDPNDDTFTGLNCGDLPDVKIRELALTQALKVDAIGQVTVDSGDYDKDKEITISADRLFIKKNAINLGGGNYLDLLFDDGDNKIFFSTNADYNAATDTFVDPLIYINADMVGKFDDFQVNGYNLGFEIVNEGDLASDPNFVNYNATKDLNDDSDDDDTLFVFEVADGNVVVDISDRMYNKDDDSDFRTDIYLTTLTGGVEIHEDQDTMLIVPEGGDAFTLDWGTDNRLDAVELAHPQEKVDSTYFIGTVEEQTVAESTITKADEGKDVSAGCCTFTVSKFDVSVGNSTDSGSATTAVVNPVVGNMVVPEVAADTTKSLILVGGPAVNAMTEPIVTRDEISAAADKFIVKKSGNMIVVAGWTADDTVAGGNALVNWLKANVHA